VIGMRFMVRRFSVGSEAFISRKLSRLHVRHGKILFANV
jgi:hypothetical protein